MVRLVPTLCVLLFCAAVAPATSSAQDVHAFWIRGETGNVAFPDNSGLGVALTFGLLDWARLQVTLDTRSSEFERIGRACATPLLNVDCIDEPIDTENRFTSITVSFLPFWEPADPLRLSAGGGLLVGGPRSENSPESGRRAKTHTVKSAQVGALGLLDVRLRPLDAVPVLLVAQWQGRLIAMDGCSDDPTAYDPFCGTDGWSELQVGVGMSF